VGGRYGSLADENVSFTEKEYEYAISRQIPILAFLHGKPEKIEVGKTDQDHSKAAKLAAFRERLARGRMVDFWTERYELCTKVVIALGQAVNLAPGVGWVRGNMVVDPSVIQELEVLRIENKRLKEALGENSEVSFPSDLAHGTDSIQFKLVCSRFDPRQHVYVAESEMQIDCSWDEIFRSLIEGTSIYFVFERSCETGARKFRFF
jgi:hypothetical protein